MEFKEITPAERQIINELRTLKPFEEIRIVADKEGKPDTFYVARTSKVMLIGAEIKYVK